MYPERTIAITGLSPAEVELAREAFESDREMYAGVVDEGTHRDLKDAQLELGNVTRVLEALDDGRLEGAVGHVRSTLLYWLHDRVMDEVERGEANGIDRAMLLLELVGELDWRARRERADTDAQTAPA